LCSIRQDFIPGPVQEAGRGGPSTSRLESKALIVKALVCCSQDQGDWEMLRNNIELID